jgi:hypothetical protein
MAMKEISKGGYFFSLWAWGTEARPTGSYDLNDFNDFNDLNGSMKI